MLLFMDGLDWYDSTADLSGTPGWAVSTGGSLSLTAGRFDGGALVCNSGFVGWTYTLPSALTIGGTYYFGFSFKVSGTMPGDSSSVTFQVTSSTGGSLCALAATPTGTFFVTPNSGGQNTTSTPGVFAPGTWCRVEVKIVFGTTSSNGSVEVRVNGQSIISLSGIDTFDGNPPTTIKFGAKTGGNNFLFDDITINDDSGSYNNSWLGDVRIDPILPTADGGDSDWTSSSGTAHNDVDDPSSASDGDTTYISSGTVGQKSSFALGDLTTPSSLVMAVQPRAKAKRSDAGARTYRSYVSSGASVANGITLTPQTDYRSDFGGIIEEDPNTSSAWIDSGINAMSVGVEVVS